MTHDPREAPQITMADIRKHTGEGMVSEQSVIDAANEVLKDIYTSPPPAEGWDEEYPFDDERFNKGVQHVVDLIARELGVTDWIAGDGSEDYDCDLWQTILNILSAKGLYDKDEGEFKALRREAPAPEGVESADDLDAEIAALAHKFWSIHPSSLDDMGLTREQFYAQEMSKLIKAVRG